MSADDDSPVAAAWHTHDDRVLDEEGMRKHLDRNTILPRILHDVCDLREQPLRRVLASLRIREPRVEGRVVLEILLNVFPVELWDKALDVLLVLELAGVWGLRFYGADFGVEFGDVEEVASASAVLSGGQRQRFENQKEVHTADMSHRSSSVICRVTPGATSIVRRALGLTSFGFASTTVAQAAAIIAETFMLAM